MNIPTKYLAIGCIALFAYQTNAKDVQRKNSSPLQFMANSGQITNQHGVVRHDIDAKIEANGVVMFMGNGQLHYQWTKTPPAPLKGSDKTSMSGASGHLPSLFRDTLFKEGIDDAAEVEIYRMDVTLVGANPNAQVVFEEPTGYYENYYLAHTGEHGAVAKGYSKVTYKNVYPNIDWVIYTPSAPLKGSDIMESQNTSSPSGEVGRGVKYDFIVHPNGNPADIRLRYDGATELKLVDGALVAVTPYGTIAEDAPYSYNAATKTEVTSNYLLTGNELRFDVGQHEGTLVIDPSLNWATYYGGSLYETEENLGVDDSANVYLSGSTLSTNNIATSGAFHATAINDWNMYVVKFNPVGVRQWGTYFADTGYSNIGEGYMTSDRNGNVYLTGSTHTVTGIATSGTHQTTHQGLGDGFMIKFNTMGQRVWGTYFGGTAFDGLGNVCITTQDEIIVTGSTASANGIATAGTYKPNFHANNGFCLLKFNSSGQQIWGTYTNFGGRIATDVYGNIYTGGGTVRDTGIATVGAHQTARGSTGMFPDGFLVKFDSTGNRLWGTYYGGSIQETIVDVIVTTPDEIYVSGGGVSSNNITTAGSFNPTYAGSGGFLAKFNKNGVRQWGTYYNGIAAGITAAAMTNGDIVVASMAQTSGLATTGAYKTTISGSYDGFWARFTPSGQRTYATYFGGSGLEQINYGNNRHSSVFIAGKYLYICGYITANSPGLTTTGAHQTVFGGQSDAFLVQFEMEDTLVAIANHFKVVHACTGDSLYVPLTVTKNFGNGNNFIVQLSNSTGSFSSPTTLATVSSNSADTIACYLPASIPAGTGYKVRVVATAPADTSLPSPFDIAIYSRPANFSAGSNSPVCTGDTLKLNSGTTTAGVTYAWSGPNSYSNATEDPVLPNATLAMAGNYYITLNNNGCAVKDTVTVVVNQTPENVTATNNGGLCTADTMKLMSSTTTGGVTYAWAGPNNYNTQNVTIPNVQLSHAGIYTVTVTLGNCSDTASTTLTVDQSAVINIVPLTPVSICKGDTAQFSGFPSFAGTNPLLQWQINGVDVPNANGTVFKTPLLVNGDKVRLEVTPNTTCPGARVSNEITMTVQDLKAPQVSITADARPSLYPNEPINFTAVATDAGNAPNYQWKKNGIDIGGATGAVWGANANALKDGDNICVLVTSTYACPSPDTALSNCIQLDIRLSVDEVVNSNSIKVYPNPVKGTLRITSTTTIETITINNLLGQQLMQQTANGNTAEIDMSALAAGVYVVKVNGSYAVRVTKE